MQKKSAWGKTEKARQKNKGIFKEHLQFWYYKWRRNTEDFFREIRRFGLPDVEVLIVKGQREQLVQFGREMR